MNTNYKFFIAGRTRNKENILKICSIFEELNISHYCFLKNEISHKEAGLDINDNHLADTFESWLHQSPRLSNYAEASSAPVFRPFRIYHLSYMFSLSLSELQFQSVH